MKNKILLGLALLVGAILLSSHPTPAKAFSVCLEDYEDGGSGYLECPSPTPSPSPSPTPVPEGIQDSGSGGGGSYVPPSCTNFKPDHAPELFQIDAHEASATLYFTPLTNNITHYYVIYGFASDGIERYSARIDLSTAPGALKYNVKDLLHDTEYFFRILPVNVCMPGDLSNTLKAKTQEPDKSYFLHN